MLFNKKWVGAFIIFTLITLLIRISNVTKLNKTGIYYQNVFNYQADDSRSDLSGKLKIHFIDVGDADCIFIQQGKESMLIDAGNTKDFDMIRGYLDDQGVKRLDTVIGTHIHEDHIGSLDCVIDNYEIGKVYLSKFDVTNRECQEVELSIKNKGLVPTDPVPGETFKLGDASCSILAPVSMGYDNLNNYSIVLKLQYGNTAFLLTGDAENKSEFEMMRRGYDLSADVLKLGHHGSITSTSMEFLERVSPKSVVLMTDKFNKYRHPHTSTMKKLKEKKIKVYRTDENGTIIAESDGNNIFFNVKPGSYNGK